MSYLLFMDESGHDGNNTHYEVRGGIAIEDDKVWACVNELRQAEEFAFGDNLIYHSGDGKRLEYKGGKHLKRARFKDAGLCDPLDDLTRQQLATAFLKQENTSRTARCAYAQACLKYAKEIFVILKRHDAKLFASMVPSGLQKPKDYKKHDFLRKDQVYLLERFYYFLEMQDSTGILVMDQSEILSDHKFVRSLERYFARTTNGRQRATRIVPIPLFVDSASSYLIQAADVCIYALNWTFRLPSKGMDESTVREELKELVGENLFELQFKKPYDGSFSSYGVVYLDRIYE